MNTLYDDLLNCIQNETVTEVYIGIHTTAVVSCQCGLASTMYFSCHNHTHSIEDAGSLVGKTSIELAGGIKSDFILQASLGMAAINSALDLNGLGFVSVNAEQLILEKGADKTVAVIGHFPFVDRLKTKVRKIYVFELEGREKEHDLLPQDMPEVLPSANVVAITATSLINHTFFDIMKYIQKKAYKIMLGPSTPLTRIMFDYDIDALCGVIVERKETLLQGIKQGCSFRKLQGKKMVTLM
ncbi:MAG: DUF364 domain-containing protein [Candidatus Hydrogenedentota bacterium]